MTHSMTGYGKAVVELPNKKVTVEIKSLNSKQFDLSIRMPAVYREKEITLRNNLSHSLERGKIDLNINVDVISRDVSSKIDFNTLSQYHREIRDHALEMSVSPPQDWFSILLRLPDVMKQDTEEPDNVEWESIGKAIERAVDDVIAFRKQEGEMLAKVLTEKIERISALLIAVEPFETERVDKIKSRIYDELNNLEGIEFDKNRFEQEMIYYIEKLDVSEEKNRLAHHLKYFTETLNGSRSQGKKLGFIAQEIGREINTLGSKSNQSDMQCIVVQMKDELEQIKEQVLNVL
ncbi:MULTISPECIES: YicC/YloC family endoribonuclease [unclassified Proteiniphilum]|uniref:YicC/YloC family endoribonuclease n=1 Tax=unclassified Proteiniphilum TaxID=2622718 RepID=UPI0025799144|nr:MULTISPECIES: YicC/YloC family endoribonuclease [unclassified Proteiniphilum]